MEGGSSQRGSGAHSRVKGAREGSPRKLRPDGVRQRMFPEWEMHTCAVSQPELRNVSFVRLLPHSLDYATGPPVCREAIRSLESGTQDTGQCGSGTPFPSSSLHDGRVPEGPRGPWAEVPNPVLILVSSDPTVPASSLALAWWRVAAYDSSHLPHYHPYPETTFTAKYSRP